MTKKTKLIQSEIKKTEINIWGSLVIALAIVVVSAVALNGLENYWLYRNNQPSLLPATNFRYYQILPERANNSLKASYLG
ncbi:MAG: hypothetical protein WCW02_03310 [Candidatus Buchananbacteria bacterium]